MTAACFLMERFGVPAPLQGDLIEARRDGSSVCWLWRQVLAALLHAVLRHLREHALRMAVIAIASTATLWIWLDATRAAFIWMSPRRGRS